MSLTVPRRKVLIVADEPAIRNVLYVLLAGLGCEGDIAHNGAQALAMIRNESFDAILVDLRCSRLSSDQVVSKISQLCPNLVGRVLVITGECADPETMEMIERHCLPYVSRSHVAAELWSRLRSLFGLSRSPADSRAVSRLPKDSQTAA